MPRRSYSRSLRYVWKRVVRVNATPYAIAIGFAAGVLVSFTPLFGFHVLLALGVTIILGGNLLSAGLGTLVGNPLTFPVILALSHRVGRVLLGEPVTSSTDLALAQIDVPPDLTLTGVQSFFEQTWPVFVRTLVGGFPLGLAAALLSYLLVYFAAATYQSTRRLRLARIAKGRALLGPDLQLETARTAADAEKNQ
ncbi:MAG: DUF2062 domain-containing protein [Pseudomonadota bacterium]